MVLQSGVLFSLSLSLSSRPTLSYPKRRRENCISALADSKAKMTKSAKKNCEIASCNGALGYLECVARPSRACTHWLLSADQSVIGRRETAATEAK